MMIADHALYNRETEAGAVLLGRIVRREEPGALFFRKTLP